MRRGIAELDGEGEVVGGIVVMRYGQERAGDDRRGQGEARSAEAGLPPGVEIVDDLRPLGADRARDRPRCASKLVEEFVVVALSASCSCSTCARRSSPSSRCRSASWPRSSSCASQGINANIMSLGGIAIAIGAMVDAAIVMIENAHKQLEQWQRRASRRRPPTARGALEADRRRVGRGRAGAVLLAADHHRLVRAGVRARGAGGAAVHAARVHQDLRDGRGRGHCR